MVKAPLRRGKALKQSRERDWVVLLNMMQPDNSYWKQLADSASTRWHLEAKEEKRFKKEREAQNAKYVRAIDPKISGEITAADFELWKASVAKEVERLEDAIKGIETSDLDDNRRFKEAFFQTGFLESFQRAL